MKNAVNERFIEAINYILTNKIAKNKSEIADNLEISRQILTEILGDRMNVQLVTLQKFFDVYNVNYDFIFNDSKIVINGNPNGNLYGNPSEKITPYSDSLSVKKSVIPFYSVEASAGIEFFFNDYPEKAEFISVPFNVSGCIAIPIYGSSMEPEYKSGDIVIIREIKDMSVLNYGFPYIIITEELRLFKIMRKGASTGHVLLHSLNQQYEPIALELSKIRKLFIVEAQISKKTT